MVMKQIDTQESPMKPISPILLLPVTIFSFLGGTLLGRGSRKNLSMLPPSKEGPLPGVPLLSWERFITIVAVAPKRTVTPRGRMGYFGLDARRLADVGFMTRPRKTTVGGETGVWTGEWRAPLTTEKFLGSAPAQYEAFRRSMMKMTPRVGAFVGCGIDGSRATLSGLLGVGHLAGEAGVESWVKNPDIRRRFKATTANFARTNGIF
jgi:hypothetical protein